MSDQNDRDDEDENPGTTIVVSGDEANLVGMAKLNGDTVISPIDEDIDRIRSRIQEISQRVDEDKLELGALFFKVREKALYLRWVSPVTGQKYKTWDEYIDNESSFSLRSIQHMVSMWWWFHQLNNFPAIRTLIHDVGWKKARVLVGLVDDENYEQWFKLAKDVTYDKLDLSVRAAKSKAGIERRPGPGFTRPVTGGVTPDIVEVRDVQTSQPKSLDDVAGNDDGDDKKKDFVKTNPVKSLDAEAERRGIDVPTEETKAEYALKRVKWEAFLDAEQKEHVEKAVYAVWDTMVEARTVSERPARDEIGRGLALEMMATHFLAFYSGASAPTKDMRTRVFFTDIMKGIEKNFGVFVMAIDKKTNNFIHGLPDEVYEAIEQKLDVDVIVFKRGTNECVFGFDTAKKMAEVVADEDNTGEDADKEPEGE